MYKKYENNVLLTLLSGLLYNVKFIGLFCYFLLDIMH